MRCRIRPRYASLKQDQRGQALVEFAIVLPLLLVLVLGIFEMGRIMNAYILIQQAARDAVRYGSVSADDADIAAAIRRNTATLDENQLTYSIRPAKQERRRGEEVEVDIQYRLQLVTPFMSRILPNPFPLEARAEMRVE